ncbi:Snf7-domain-containing protein [Ramicandelaber brevisporus]|nr:Snf7-domain-containing protein [Ramicandelaber brevisporus]
MISWLFGQKSPAELLRQHQRSLNKAQRELDRERTKLEQQEKKLISDIKRTAKSGNRSACVVMAKDLVRTRAHVQKFYNMRTQLQAVSLRIQTLRSNQQMAEAMRGATRAMKAMNRGINLPQLQKILVDFEKESEMMDMREEVMGDAIDDAMEGDLEDEEEATDRIVQQVFDEIGITVDAELNTVGIKSGSVANPAVANDHGKVSVSADGMGEPILAGGHAGGNNVEDELMKRIASLGRD